MNNMQIFKYENNDVRTVEMNGEPWFVLKDVCKALSKIWQLVRVSYMFSPELILQKRRRGNSPAVYS